VSYYQPSKVLKPLSKELREKAHRWGTAEPKPLALSRLEAIEREYHRVWGSCACLLIGNGRHKLISAKEYKARLLAARRDGTDYMPKWQPPCEELGFLDHSTWFRHRRTREYVLLTQPYKYVLAPGYGYVERLAQWGERHGVSVRIDENWEFWYPRSEADGLFAVGIRLERAKQPD
jgi:hypothetical protein